MIAEVVGDERNVHIPRENGIGSREVVYPKERLTAEVDARWEECEHGEEEGHLEQHGQTAAERACSCEAVESHCLLLTCHGIVLAGVFLVDGLDVGGEETHLCLRHVGLVHERPQSELDNKRH